MKIALIGTRGIPARYGGFETCAEEISIRLREKGHDVRVYCRTYNHPDRIQSYKGVTCVYVPSINRKSLDTITHTLFSMLHLMFHKVDVALVFNAANSPLCVIPKLLRIPLAINVDGLEWRRKKWGRVARQYYQISEKISSWIADVIISDAQAIRRYYLDRYHRDSVFIAYGANIESSEKPEILKEYGLSPGQYFFVASRLEPENNADITVKAFEGLETDKKLIIAGGANYESSFIKALKSTSDPRIHFLGPVYKEGHIKELHCNAFAYVHGNEVGGTNPALLKAMGYANCVLALDNEFNSEVVGDSALLYKKNPEDLRMKMRLILDNEGLRQSCRQKATERIKEVYTWEKIADGYEKVCLDLMR